MPDLCRSGRVVEPTVSNRELKIHVLSMCGSVSDRDVSHILLRLVPLDLIGVVVVVEQGGFPRPGAHPSNPSNPPPTHPRPSPPWCASSLLCLIQQFCHCLLLTTTMHDMLPICYGLPFRFTSRLLRLAEASRFQISCVLFTSRLQVYDGLFKEVVNLLL